MSIIKETANLVSDERAVFLAFRQSPSCLCLHRAFPPRVRGERESFLVSFVIRTLNLWDQCPAHMFSYRPYLLDYLLIGSTSKHNYFRG